MLNNAACPTGFNASQILKIRRLGKLGSVKFVLRKISPTYASLQSPFLSRTRDSIPCWVGPSVTSCITEQRAIIALLPLPNRPRLGCRVPGLFDLPDVFFYCGVVSTDLVMAGMYRMAGAFLLASLLAAVMISSGGAGDEQMALRSRACTGYLEYIH